MYVIRTAGVEDWGNNNNKNVPSIRVTEDVFTAWVQGRYDAPARRVKRTRRTAALLRELAKRVVRKASPGNAAGGSAKAIATRFYTVRIPS